MNLPKNIIESIIVTLIVDVIILRLLFGSFLKRQKNKGKGQRYLVGLAMTFLGFVLISIGLYLFIGWIIS